MRDGTSSLLSDHSRHVGAEFASKLLEQVLKVELQLVLFPLGGFPFPHTGDFAPKAGSTEVNEAGVLTDV